jgi:hypothetical protein
MLKPKLAELIERFINPLYHNDLTSCESCKCCQEEMDKLITAILSCLKESLPKERIVQIGDSQYGGYPRNRDFSIDLTKSINPTRGQKLFLGCAEDSGYNQCLQEVKKLLE